MKCECGRTLTVVDFIRSDGTTNRPYDKVITQCPGCKTVKSSVYNPVDWMTQKHVKIIEKLMKGDDKNVRT